VSGGAALRAVGLTWWDAWFHALSGFANAGFSTLDGSVGATPSSAVAIVCILVVVGGVGYPVSFEIFRRLRPRPRSPWSYTAHLTLLATAALLTISTAVFAALEWDNDATLGNLPLPRRLAALATLVVMPRSAGFNLTDTAELADGSTLFTVALMFIGAGPAATAGGIKTTGAAVLFIALVAACKGRTEAQAGRFNIAPRVVNHAVAVAACLAATILALAVVLAANTEASAALFNATSAVTTTGLSIGSAASTDMEKLAMSVAMLVGRLAPMLLAVRLTVSLPPPLRPPAKTVLIT
jgi:trk system potassium uptake protein